MGLYYTLQHMIGNLVVPSLTSHRSWSASFRTFQSDEIVSEGAVSDRVCCASFPSHHLISSMRGRAVLDKVFSPFEVNIVLGSAPSLFAQAALKALKSESLIQYWPLMTVFAMG
jgi:hypothetical protein